MKFLFSYLDSEVAHFNSENLPKSLLHFDFIIFIPSSPHHFSHIFTYICAPSLLTELENSGVSATGQARACPCAVKTGL
jgi:hypothetical protein